MNDEEVISLIRQGAFRKANGDLKGAIESYERALSVGDSGADPSLLGTAAGDLGVVHDLLGEPTLPPQFYNLAINHFGKAGDGEAVVGQYVNLAIFYQRLGAFKTALENLKLANGVFGDQTPEKLMSSILETTGLVFMTSGHMDLAKKYYQQAMELENKLGREERIASCVGNIGIICFMMGDIDAAEKMHTHSLAIHLKLNLKMRLAADYTNLGVLHQSKGDYATAEALFRRALEIDEGLEHWPGIGNDLGNLGDLSASKGDIEQADIYWRKAKSVFERINSPHLVAQINERLSHFDLRRY